MADETLFTAARRAVRDFNIDMNRGGLVTTQTEQSMGTLSKMLQSEEKRLRALGDPTVVGEPQAEGGAK